MKEDLVLSAPLANVRVVDLTHVWAGPVACRILADLGADVIKVELGDKPDSARMGYIADSDYSDEFWNRALYFQRSQAGKRAITLDLASHEGAGVLRGLLATADVLVENFTPRVMRSLGFDYETVRAIRPDIVMLSISAYGQSGPRMHYGGFGTGLEPASGISQLTGYPGGPPTKNGNTFVDPLGGTFAAGAILTALHYRRRTGKGQYIDLALQETTVHIAGEALADFQLNERPWSRRGNRSDATAPQGIYRCLGDDEWLYLSVGSDVEWRSFAAAIGGPDWASDHRFSTVLGRREHIEELDCRTSEWSCAQDKFDAMHRLQAAGVLAAAVLNPKEVLLNPQLKARSFFTPVEMPGSRAHPVQRFLAARFQRIDASPRGRAPGLGEHTEQLLRELVGLGEAEIEALRERGTINREPAFATSTDTFVHAIKPQTTRYRDQGAVKSIDGDYREVLQNFFDDRLPPTVETDPSGLADGKDSS